MVDYMCKFFKNVVLEGKFVSLNANEVTTIDN